MKRRGLALGPGRGDRGHDEYRSRALGHIQKEHQRGPPGAQSAIDIGRAQIAAAVFAQIDSTHTLAGDEAEGKGAHEIGQDENDDQQHEPGPFNVS